MPVPESRVGASRMSDGRVRYARNGDVRLAYRVFGEGELTLVWVPGWVSNVDLYDDPTTPFAPLVAHLARTTRLVVWDKRGTGLSDPVTRIPPLDERMDDLNAVLDAVDAGRPALLGISEGGPMSILFAATYPERVAPWCSTAPRRGLYVSRPISSGACQQVKSRRALPISTSIGRGLPSHGAAWRRRAFPWCSRDARQNGARMRESHYRAKALAIVR